MRVQIIFYVPNPIENHPNFILPESLWKIERGAIGFLLKIDIGAIAPIVPTLKIPFDIEHQRVA